MEHYSVFDHLLEGCQIIDFDFRYVYVNEVAAKHGLKTREELVGHTMMEVTQALNRRRCFLC